MKMFPILHIFTISFSTLAVFNISIFNSYNQTLNVMPTKWSQLATRWNCGGLQFLKPVGQTLTDAYTCVYGVLVEAADTLLQLAAGERDVYVLRSSRQCS